jgi:hypothetical protein
MKKLNRRELGTMMAVSAGIAALPTDTHATIKGRRTTSMPSRTAPMFKDEADARAVIKRYCIDESDEPIKRADIDMLMKKLRPQLFIEPRGNQIKPDMRSHFGGVPDGPPGMTWPVRTAESVAAQAAYLSKTFGNRVTFGSYLTRDVPFEFVAQIDCTEAALHPLHSVGLPSTGRLLFFWDDIVGTYAGGAHACRVIHDQTQPHELVAASIPKEFDDLERAWRTANSADAKAQFEGMLKALPDSSRLMREAGLDEASIAAAEKALRDLAAKPPENGPNARKPFVYPRRQMQLTPIWQLPSTHTPEFILDADLARFGKTDAGQACHSLMTSLDDGPFKGAEHRDSEALRNRVLGTPIPEQDDPRFETLGKPGENAEPWSEVKLRRDAQTISSWRLLLQLSMADLAHASREGTVYFIIRNDALAAREFSHVEAYYQQT